LTPVNPRTPIETRSGEDNAASNDEQSTSSDSSNELRPEEKYAVINQ